MKLIRRIGPLRMMGIKVTALGAMFWFAWAIGSYQTVYLQSNGLSASQVGVLNAVSYAVIIVGVSFWGRMSDKIGSLKKVLFLILLFGCGLYALIPMIPTGLAYSPLLFTAAISLINFFRGSAITMSENIQVRNCNELRLNYGMSRATGSLLYTFGSLLAAFLLREHISVSTTFWLSFLLMIPVIVLLVFVREPAGRSKSQAQLGKDQTSVRVLLKNRKYMTFLVFALLLYMASNCSASFIAFYMVRIGVDSTQMGIILAYRAFLEIPLLLLMNRLHKKFSLVQMMIIGVIMIMLESVLLGTVVNSLFTMLAATTLYGLGNGLYIGTSMNHLYELAPAPLRASAQAYFAATSSAAGIIGNLLGGLLFDGIGAKPFYLVIAAIYLSSALVLILSNRKKKPAKPLAIAKAQPKQTVEPMNMYSYKELLEKVRQEYGINSATLSKLTDIPAEIIDHEPDDFSPDFYAQHAREYQHLFSTLGFLNEKCQIDEDSYLRGHMNNLIQNFNISKEAISKFTGIELNIIEAFLQDGCEIEIEKKYQMSVRFLFMEWLLTRNPYIDI